MGRFGHGADIVDRADAVLDVGEGDHLGLFCEQGVVVIHVDLEAVGQADALDSGAGLLGNQVPRDEIGVMLHLGDQDQIARFQVGPTPRLRDEVDRLGCVADEDDFALIGSADKGGECLAGVLVEAGGLFRQLIDTAMNVRVGFAVEGRDRVNDGLRLLRAGGTVEEDERIPAG